MIHHLMLLSGLTTLTTYITNSSYYDYSQNNNQMHVVKFLKTINEGQIIVNDMCENLDDNYHLFTGSTKPFCDYNMSYINNESVNVFPINKDIKTFFINEKQQYCNKGSIECGELTIIIKLLDLINSAVNISVINENVDNLLMNIEILDFNTLFKLYKTSLNNNELLTNITLSKQRANILLTKEKERLYNELNKDNSVNYFKSFFQNDNVYSDNSQQLNSNNSNIHTGNFSFIVVAMTFLIVLIKC
jgi:hypothetical protein